MVSVKALASRLEKRDDNHGGSATAAAPSVRSLAQKFESNKKPQEDAMRSSSSSGKSSFSANRSYAPSLRLRSSTAASRSREIKRPATSSSSFSGSDDHHHQQHPMKMASSPRSRSGSPLKPALKPTRSFGSSSTSSSRRISRRSSSKTEFELQQEQNQNNSGKHWLAELLETSLSALSKNAHVLFLCMALLLRLLCPRVVMTLVATRSLVLLISLYVPFLCTLAVVCQYKEQKALQAKERNSRFIRPSPKSLLPGSMEDTLDDEMKDWLRFWTVRATAEALKCLLLSTAFWGSGSAVDPATRATVLQMELLFYSWLHGMPVLQAKVAAFWGDAASLSGEGRNQLIEKRPLRLLCKHGGPYSQWLVEAASGAVPADWWQTQVVGLASQITAALVLLKVLTQPTADKLVHATHEGRTLVVPALALLVPGGFLAEYGVTYVQYVLGIAKSYKGGLVGGTASASANSATKTTNASTTTTTALWLQYWILHATLDGLLYYAWPVLRWIPFASHALFGVWYYVSLPPSVEFLFGEIESELRLLGLLSSSSSSSGSTARAAAPQATDRGGGGFEETKTAQFLGQIWELLPKAEDAEELVVSQTTQVDAEEEEEDAPTAAAESSSSGLPTTPKRQPPVLQDTATTPPTEKLLQEEDPVDTSPVPAEPESLTSTTADAAPSPSEVLKESTKSISSTMSTATATTLSTSSSSLSREEKTYSTIPVPDDGGGGSILPPRAKKNNSIGKIVFKEGAGSVAIALSEAPTKAASTLTTRLDDDMASEEKQ